MKCQQNLGDLREFLGELLDEKNRIAVLVDNLDKAWEKGKTTKEISDFLFGLLSGGQNISRDFIRGSRKAKPINLSLIIFLRSDIFSYIMLEARESDKINNTRIDWNDDRLLLRIIEERFLCSLGDESEASDVWDKYFDLNVNGLATKDYIVSRIIPRPRDIIFFCKSAMSNAINHKNSKITAEDILQAEKSYSEYVFNSLLAETEVRYSQIEEILYEFVGGSDIIDREDLIT